MSNTASFAKKEKIKKSEEHDSQSRKADERNCTFNVPTKDHLDVITNQHARPNRGRSSNEDVPLMETMHLVFI